MCRASLHQGVFPVLPSLLPIPPSIILRVTALNLAARKSLHLASHSELPRMQEESTGFRTARLRVQTPSDRPPQGSPLRPVTSHAARKCRCVCCGGVSPDGPARGYRAACGRARASFPRPLSASVQSLRHGGGGGRRRSAADAEIQGAPASGISQGGGLSGPGPRSGRSAASGPGAPGLRANRRLSTTAAVAPRAACGRERPGDVGLGLRLRFPDSDRSCPGDRARGGGSGSGRPGPRRQEAREPGRVPCRVCSVPGRERGRRGPSSNAEGSESPLWTVCRFRLERRKPETQGLIP